MIAGNEDTGIAREGMRRSAHYARYINRPAPTVDEAHLARMVDKAVERELRPVVERVVARQVADNRMLATMIHDAVEIRVGKVLDELVTERLKAISRRVDPLPAIAPRLALDEIISRVAAVTDITVGELLGERRSTRVARPRQLAYWLARKLRPDLSLPRIGAAFRRDHTTLMLGVRRVEQLKDTDPFRTWLAAPAIVALLGPGTEG